MVVIEGIPGELPDRATLYPLAKNPHVRFDQYIRALPVVLPDPDEEPIAREKWIQRLYGPDEMKIASKLSILSNTLSTIKKQKLPVAKLFEQSERRLGPTQRVSTVYKRTSPLTQEELNAVLNNLPMPPIVTSVRPIGSLVIHVGDRFRGLWPE